MIDYSHDGSVDEEFTRADIDSLRANLSSPARVVSYMSIGEAESYRFYWQENWRVGFPDWLDSENPNWEGNFKVRYWQSEWQALIFGSPGAYLDRILASGFDGVYLDIIDAYNYYEDEGVDEAADLMIKFVLDLAAYSRAKNPDFMIFPQNSSELGSHARYLAAVDGIGVESVYYGYEETGIATDPDVTAELEEYLEVFTSAGKIVLNVDYVSGADEVASAYRRARLRGFVPTVTDVDLNGPPFPEPNR